MSSRLRKGSTGVLRSFSSNPSGRLRSLLRILSPEKGHLAAAGIALTATSGGTLAFPYFSGKLMDGFSQSSATSSDVWIDLVHTNTAACLGALCLVGVGGFARAYLLETASERIARRLRIELFQSLLHKPQSYFDSAQTGDLVSRLGTDVTRVSRSIMDGAFGFRVLINATAGTVLVAKAVPLAIVPQLLAPVGAMFVGGVVYGRFVRGIARRQTDANASAMQVAEESLSLIRVVKLFNGEPSLVAKYGSKLDAVYSLAQSNALATGGKVAAFVTIGGGFIIHVIYNCGMLISTGTLTLGQTTALAGYLLVCGNAYQGLVTSYGDIQKALGACDRITHITSSTREGRVDVGNIGAFTSGVKGMTHPVEFSGEEKSIKFENVNFSYSPNGPEILSNFSMHVPPNAKQAIVGLSGSGKSSILMLLAKMYSPSSGRILVGNADLSAVSGTTVRENLMSFVPQETTLFNDSIRRNIWFPSDPAEIDPQRLRLVESAVTEAARLDFVTNWDSLVGERGQNLSGGQRQRIAIARALVRARPVLLLDEATSALDRESDELILGNLKKLKNTTIVAVTHKMNAIEWSDRLTVVDNGHTVQEGDTVDLLRNPGPVLQRLLTQIRVQSS